MQYSFITQTTFQTGRNVRLFNLQICSCITLATLRQIKSNNLGLRLANILGTWLSAPYLQPALVVLLLVSLRQPT